MISTVPALKTIDDYINSIGVYKVVEVGDTAGSKLSNADRSALFALEKSLWASNPSSMNTILYYASKTNELMINVVSLLRKYEPTQFPGADYPNSLILYPVILKTADSNSRVKILNDSNQEIEIAIESYRTIRPADKGINHINWDTPIQSASGLTVNTDSTILPRHDYSINYFSAKADYNPLFIYSALSGEIALPDCTYNNVSGYFPAGGSQNASSGYAGYRFSLSTLMALNKLIYLYSSASVRHYTLPRVLAASNSFDGNPDNLQVTCITSNECHYCVADNVCLTSYSGDTFSNRISSTISDSSAYSTATYIPFDQSNVADDFFQFGSDNKSCCLLYLPLFKSAIFTGQKTGATIQVYRVANSVLERKTIAESCFRFKIISGTPAQYELFVCNEDISVFIGITKVSGDVNYTVITKKDFKIVYVQHVFIISNAKPCDMGIAPSNITTFINGENSVLPAVCSFASIFDDMKLLNLNGFNCTLDGTLWSQPSHDENGYWPDKSIKAFVMINDGELHKVTSTTGNSNRGEGARLLTLNGNGGTTILPEPKYNPYGIAVYERDTDYAAAPSFESTKCDPDQITSMLAYGTYNGDVYLVQNAVFVYPKNVTP